MLLKEALLTIALTFPAPWHSPGTNPETPEAYRERLGTITEAIALEAAASPPLPEGENAAAAAVLVLFHGESGFELAVHTNQGKTRWGQDEGRARCLGQLHSSGLVPKPEWESLAGADLEATRRCARATLRMLRAQYWVCKQRGGTGGRVARMYEAYATGRSCDPGHRSTNRAHLWQKVTARIWALLREKPKEKPEQVPPSSPPKVGWLPRYERMLAEARGLWPPEAAFTAG